jgi:hypothetical protein
MAALWVELRPVPWGFEARFLGITATWVRTTITLTLVSGRISVLTRVIDVPVAATPR